MLDDDTTDNSTTDESSTEPTAAPENASTTSTVTSSTRRRGAGRPAGPPAALNTDIFAPPTAGSDDPEPEADDTATAEEAAEKAPAEAAKPAAAIAAMFQAPPAELAPPKAKPKPEPERTVEADDDDADDDAEDDDSAPKRRRRSRGGRRRRKNGDDGDEGEESKDADTDQHDLGKQAAEADDTEDGNGSTSRRRRRRARSGEDAESTSDDPENTVVKVREGRSAEDEITGVTGSTRLEAKKQRRREGREAGRRRAPIVSEAEFLARRESVNREMVVRQRDDYTQIAVLEDKVLVEHYVARESQVSIIGNVYLGKVQNVLPSMEAAFVDIGAGRNAVIYAGEVDWSNVENGKQRKIEDALQPGQTILVQVTKDPIGQKGARLTSQISLPGRFLVYVPGGGSNGISRKLPDSERSRLKGLLKEVLPDNASVIVRTAAEGATEEQLTRDVQALSARWEDIERKVAAGKAPELLYAEPDLMIKVVRDLFNEDFAKLTVQGDEAWDMVQGYIGHVAPDIADRLERWEGDSDVFAEYRLDEQIHKALDRKVHLPSGGSLVIDRTEAMTVVDVNTGRFTGSGGNLEETVTKNNLEAAEEIVRQLRLRDIGGIIVIDFIDMVLESNRDLVLRRLVECLGRDRTRHQVAEVTSLGLVQMTRKRIGTGLLESFSHECEHCKGRGVVIADEPVEPKRDEARRRRGGRGGKGRGGNGDKQQDVPNEQKPDTKSGQKVETTSEQESVVEGKAESGKRNRRQSKPAEPQSGDAAADSASAEPATQDEPSGSETIAEATVEASSSAEQQESQTPAQARSRTSRSRRKPKADQPQEPAPLPLDQPEAAEPQTVEQSPAETSVAADAEAQNADDATAESAPIVVTRPKRTRKRATRPAAAPEPSTPVEDSSPSNSGEQPAPEGETGPVLTEDGSGQ
ncbi:Rne/Rng family ribonuclease [Aeromicrobium phragmitis]|uniref:Ribonuclease E n=1 Tax=Aeromicrobium phragmitis TaxID=2478914 RepID=A0A3L8PKF9_9ACTN|nr:Rne/Rng family ribonuclease [Aeromicrobium phragmitis]RLV55203.1 Rne/Rng family ribonuclease [Aeromicrobium phragmitis]